MNGQLVATKRNPLTGTVLPAGASEDIWTSDRPLDYENARALHELIHTTKDLLWWMLRRAHAGEIWKPLGYKSWSEYVREEFNLSRQHANNLINAANVVDAIAEVAPPGTHIMIEEATTRDIKHVLDTVVPQVAEATAGATPEQASAIIAEITGQARNDYRASRQDAAAEPSGENDEFDEELFNGFDPVVPADAADEPAPPAVTHQANKDLMQAHWDLLSVMALLEKGSPLSQLSPTETAETFLHDPRRDWVEKAIDDGVSWLADFQAAWQSFAEPSSPANEHETHSSPEPEVDVA